MSKQFKQYSAHTTDSNTGELIVARNPIAEGSTAFFTYPAEFSEKKVRGLIANKLNRAEDAVFIKSQGLVELV